MINFKELDGRFEVEAFGTVSEVLRVRFKRYDVPKAIVSAILEEYKKKPEMVRDRTCAAVTLFDLLHPKSAGGFSEMEASCLERILRPTMMKLASPRQEY